MTNERLGLADSRQDAGYDRLVARLAARTDEIASRVADDVGRPAEVETLAGLVRRLLESVELGERIADAERARLRAEGAAAATAGERAEAIIDRYLTAGWVAWEAAADLAAPDERDALTTLGGVLLRAGDDVAAALAEGHAAVEAARAARGGAMRSAVLDELLTGGARGVEVSRVARRATLVGLDPDRPVRLVLARASSEIEEEGPVTAAVGAAIARTARTVGSLVVARGGDLVVVVGEPGPPAAAVADALGSLGPAPWWAVRGEGSRITELPTTYPDLVDALRVVRRVGPERTVVDASSVALERAMTADRRLAEAAVESLLGPLRRSPRSGSEAVETLEAWFGAGESVTRAARALQVAPRTVSYRLARIARLLGRDALDADLRSRLAAALLLRRLVEPE
jgi:DNA-binding PucR family transcriptional regulator